MSQINTQVPLFNLSLVNLLIFEWHDLFCYHLAVMILYNILFFAF